MKNELDSGSNAYLGPDPSAAALLPSQILVLMESANDKGRPPSEDEEMAQTAVQPVAWISGVGGIIPCHLNVDNNCLPVMGLDAVT